MTRLDRADLLGACRGLLVLAALATVVVYALLGASRVKPAEWHRHETIYRPAVEPARPTNGEY